MRHPYSASFSHPTGSHRYPIRQTNSVANLFPTPHRPTKLLIAPAACKSLKILEVASRALASLLITERGICGNRAESRAAAEATRATSLRFSLGKRAKKIPTDKSWDFEYWWRRRELNPRPQALRNRAQLAKFLSSERVRVAAINLCHRRAAYLRYLGDRLDGRAVVGPCLHQKGALFNQIPPPVGGLDFVRKTMC